MQGLHKGLSVIAVHVSGGLTPSITVGGGAEADDGDTAIAVVIGNGQQWQQRGQCVV